MKVTKQDIIDASIDLFAKRGIQNVSLATIASSLDIVKGTIYHHFKGGKDEIVDNIVMMFDEMIKHNTPNKKECLDIKSDARSVLSRLFFVIRAKDSEKCRKINRILFSDQHYNESIKKYMFNDIMAKREEDIIKCFNLLVQNKKVEPFNTVVAARMLNNIYLAHALKDSHYIDFKPNELPPDITELQNECMHIVQQILNGNFPD